MNGRAAATAGMGIAVAITMVLAGTEPRLVLVAFITIAAATIGFCLFDVGNVTSAITWQAWASTTPRSGAGDRRVQMLQVRLRRTSPRRRPSGSDDPDAPDGSEPDDDIAATLIAVIDDHLAAEHGFNRADDPSAAATLLGPQLSQFVDDRTARRRMVRRKELAATVGLIETFCDRRRDDSTR